MYALFPVLRVLHKSIQEKIFLFIYVDFYILVIFGDDRWGFAFYAYGNQKYELCAYPNGEFIGKPEDAFLTSEGYLES